MHAAGELNREIKATERRKFRMDGCNRRESPPFILHIFENETSPNFRNDRKRNPKVSVGSILQETPPFDHIAIAQLNKKGENKWWNWEAAWVKFLQRASFRNDERKISFVGNRMEKSCKAVCRLMRNECVYNYFNSTRVPSHQAVELISSYAAFLFSHCTQS